MVISQSRNQIKTMDARRGNDFRSTMGRYHALVSLLPSSVAHPKTSGGQDCWNASAGQMHRYMYLSFMHPRLASDTWSRIQTCDTSCWVGCAPQLTGCTLSYIRYLQVGSPHPLAPIKGSKRDQFSERLSRDRPRKGCQGNHSPALKDSVNVC